MGMSNYLQGKLLNHVFQGSAYTAASQPKLALGTSAPSPGFPTSWFGELSGNGYARQNIGFHRATGRDKELAEVRNAATIEFPEATANWSTATYWAVWDDAGTPNILAWGKFCESVSVGSGEVLTIPEEALAITIVLSHYSLPVQRALLDHTFAGHAYSQPADLYFAASKGAVYAGIDPQDFDELSGNGYARVQHNSWSIVGESASNSGNASFPTATGDWPDDIVGIGILDASSGGNLIATVPLESAVSINSGDVFRLPSGSVQTLMSESQSEPL